MDFQTKASENMGWERTGSYERKSLQCALTRSPPIPLFHLKIWR